MQTDDSTKYCSFVQEAMREYCNIFDSEKWEPTDSKKNPKDEPLLMKASTVAIEASLNKSVEKFYFINRHDGKDNNSGGGSSTKSVATYHNCGKKGHLKSN